MSEINSEIFDLYHECYGNAFFVSLWKRAWGEEYPPEIEPLSSATRTLLRQLLNELRGCGPGSRLLDLGCGSGGVGCWLARELGTRLVGVDFSPRAIELARSHAGNFLPAGRAEFHVGDFVDTGLDTDSVDLAVSVDALIMAPDVDAALKEVRRILVRGGRLVFTTREAERDSERRALVGPEWRYALDRNGLATTKIIKRPEVAGLWKRVFSLWLDNEERLRAELPSGTVDLLIEEASAGKASLAQDRDWLLISATGQPA